MSLLSNVELLKVLGHYLKNGNYETSSKLEQKGDGVKQMNEHNQMNSFAGMESS